MSHGAGFTKLGEDELVRGHIFTVVKARFRGPGGDEFERHIVHHPGAVAVVPLHDDGSVTLVRQYRAALDRDLLELPAGTRDVEGEPEARTAERELTEEAGLRAGTIEHLVTLHNAPGLSDEAVTVFLAQDLRGVADDRQGVEEEAMTVERIALSEALAMVDDGRITDAKTIIGLTLTERRLR
ncbi:MAG: NUDIX hydrolase [Acidimicrobiales bacterium]